MTMCATSQAQPVAAISAEAGPPFVTVVVPVYNGRASIARCIEALLAQDYPSHAYTIVVVDNNSSDDTAALVRDYPVALAFEREIQTSYAARNRGIALAETEIIAFLDADCRADLNWLRNLVQPFQDKDVGVVGGKRASEMPASDATLVERFLEQVLVHDERLYHPSEPMGFPTANVAYRAAALDKVGIFNPAMPGAGDVDLAWRVQILGGYRGVYAPGAVVYHRHHATLSAHFRQYRGYGFDEIALGTLYRDHAFPRRTPAFQLKAMARQVAALVAYGLSFLVRLVRWRRWRSDRLYLAWPMLWFITDVASLTGKTQGLLRTRCFRRNPYSDG